MASKSAIVVLFAALLYLSVPSDGFSTLSSAGRRIATTRVDASSQNADKNDAAAAVPETERRTFLNSGAAALLSMASFSQSAVADDGSSVESIASRAARLTKTVEDEQRNALEEAELASPTTVQPSTSPNADSRTIYDFDLPVNGLRNTMTELVGRKDKGSSSDVKQPRVVLFVNIKQDDVVARKNIPELIALASRFGRDGDFAVVCSPTDQGYYEPDTSQLLRLKLAQEYGYGINPATIVTDKVNLLGTGAHPFWRWIQGTARAPDGLGRIRGNFEKFLVVDGRPVRRYPRKYEPKDIQDDIEALLNGRSLPPAGSNWREQWRSAAKEAEADTYRFQKGLNVFDQ